MVKKIFSFFRKSVQITGEITAFAGAGSVQIPVRGIPQTYMAVFVTALPPVGCGPIVVDDLTITSVRLRRVIPIYALRIDWNIRSGSPRDILWGSTVKQ